MKGKPRPGFTPARLHWLRQLKMHGAMKSSGTAQGLAAYSARELGWSEWAPGTHMQRLTAEGERVLARWEAGDRADGQYVTKTAANAPGIPFQPDLSAFADWLVANDRADEFLAMLIDRGVLEPSVPRAEPEEAPAPLASGGLVVAPPDPLPLVGEVGPITTMPVRAQALDPPAGHARCPRCSGTGRGGFRECQTCYGKGHIARRETPL